MFSSAWAWRGLAAALCMSMLAAVAAAQTLLPFTPEETAQIARHGPWPMPPARDPGNPVAGRAAAIALGEQLFFDRRLSHDGRLACASCHAPALAFSDGQPRSMAREQSPLADEIRRPPPEGAEPPGRAGSTQALDRNAPSLLNAGQQRWYGWDGASDSLWSQALRVMLEPREFGSSPAQLQTLVHSDRELSCRWRQVFGGIDAKNHERTMVQMAQAIGAYVGSLQSPRTAFDDFRDALLRGDKAAAATYPLPAQRGLQLFIGRARCALCHLGPLFSNREFADAGVPFFVRPGEVDSGRHGGIATLQASRYNLLGAWARLRSPDEATKTRHVQPQHRNFGEFKVPSLRHVVLTAPYMHDGSIATLPEVIRHYDRMNLERLHNDGERILRPLYLSEGERDDLLAFLRSLGDQPIVVAPVVRKACR